MGADGMSAQLHEFARRSAERDPDVTAIVLGAERLTYGELEEDSTASHATCATQA
jgi:non-ribosomal peptide synthetase component E (peptide arylation enzyme)